MRRPFTLGDAEIVLETDPAPDGSLKVRLPDGTEQTVAARRLPGDVIEIEANGRVFRVPMSRTSRGEVSLAWDGGVYTFAPASARRPGTGRAAARSGVLTAPMVGVVADVPVSVGDRVTAYQPVAVVEAMKVLATIEAPFAGVVRAVHVQKGDRVEHGAPLVEVVAEVSHPPSAVVGNASHPPSPSFASERGGA